MLELLPLGRLRHWCLCSHQLLDLLLLKRQQRPQHVSPQDNKHSATPRQHALHWPGELLHIVDYHHLHVRRCWHLELVAGMIEPFEAHHGDAQCRVPRPHKLQQGATLAAEHPGIWRWLQELAPMRLPRHRHAKHRCRGFTAGHLGIEGRSDSLTHLQQTLCQLGCVDNPGVQNYSACTPLTHSQYCGWLLCRSYKAWQQCNVKTSGFLRNNPSSQLVTSSPGCMQRTTGGSGVIPRLATSLWLPTTPSDSSSCVKAGYGLTYAGSYACSATGA